MTSSKASLGSNNNIHLPGQPPVVNHKLKTNFEVPNDPRLRALCDNSKV